MSRTERAETFGFWMGSGTRDQHSIVPAWFKRMRRQKTRTQAKRKLDSEEGPEPDRKCDRWDWF